MREIKKTRYIYIDFEPLLKNMAISGSFVISLTVRIMEKLISLKSDVSFTLTFSGTVIKVAFTY